MRFFKGMLRRRSHKQLRELALLCAGAALLVAVTLILVGSKGTFSNLAEINPATQTASWLSCFFNNNCGGQGTYTVSMFGNQPYVGHGVTLTWTSTGSTYCMLSGGPPDPNNCDYDGDGNLVCGNPQYNRPSYGETNVPANGSITSNPIYDTTHFHMLCSDWTGQGGASVDADITPLPEPAVVADATAVSATVHVGQSATINFHADSADPPTQCNINNYNDSSTLLNVAGCSTASNRSYTTPVYSVAGVYAYKFYYYRASSWTLVKTVNITVVGAPSATITANGTATSLTVIAGTPVTIHAAFTVDTADGDTGSVSDIVGDAANPNGETGVRTTTTYAATKDYSLTPAVGTYTYYPQLSTTQFPTLSQYPGVTLTVQAPCTAGPQDLEGWGWSDSIGWVSANCANDPTSLTTYGLKVDNSGTITGYAWSDSVGWLRPAVPADSCPGSGVTVSQATNQFSGWLKALSSTPSWDGCVSMSCTNDGTCATSNYTVTDQANNLTSGTNFADAAWGGLVPGWIVFDLHFPQSAPVCSDSTHVQQFINGFSTTTACTGGSQCVSGACTAPANPTGCVNLNASSCSPLTQTLRIRSGATTGVYWSVSNVTTNCSLTGSNGQTVATLLSGGATSGSGTVTTNPITSPTTYTLSCDSGAFSQTATINIVPAVKEI